MPSHLGRLPTLVGVPAGGSLTADQWLLLATVVGPLAVCNKLCLADCYLVDSGLNYRSRKSGKLTWVTQMLRNCEELKLFGRALPKLRKRLRQENSGK